MSVIKIRCLLTAFAVGAACSPAVSAESGRPPLDCAGVNRGSDACPPPPSIFAGKIWGDWGNREAPEPLGCLGIARDQELALGSRVQVFIEDAEPRAVTIEELTDVPQNKQKVRELGFEKVKREGLWRQLACPWSTPNGAQEVATFQLQAPRYGRMIAVANVTDSTVVLGGSVRSLENGELQRLRSALSEAVPEACRSADVLYAGSATLPVDGHEIVDFRLGVFSHATQEFDSVTVCRFLLHNGVLLSQWIFSRTAEPITEESTGVLGPELTEETWSQIYQSVLGFLGWEGGARWQMLVTEGGPEGTTYKALDLDPEPKIVWMEFSSIR